MLGCGVAMVVMVAVALVALMALGALPGSDSSPRTSTPTPTATSPVPEPDPTPTEPEPEPEPAAFELPPRDFGELPPPHSDNPAWVTVQQSPFYTARFPVSQGCPEPAHVEDLAALETYTTAQLACVQNAWEPVLTALALPAHAIPHHYYTGSSANSPCGTSTAPAFYCAANGGAIYFGEDLLQGTAYDPIWAKDLVGHEYGHHLQALSGFLNVFNELPGGDEVWRRLEIQATCYSMGMLRKDRSHELTQQSFEHLDRHLRSFLDDGIHGSKESLAYWGMRGFYSDHAAGCNTWVVGPEWVE